MLKTIEMELSARVGVGGAGGVGVSERGLAVAALFGIAVGVGEEEVLFEKVRLEIGVGDVVLITGASGAGKSTLLRCIREALLREKDISVVALGEIGVEGDRAVVDCFGGSLEEGLGHLARAGLSEAHLLLRSPAELSEGQRFRYRLARFFASDADVLIADEFGATLDRVTARVVAYQLGKFVAASGGGSRPRAVIVATTHEDLEEDLRPTVRIWKGFGDRVDVTMTTTGIKHEGHEAAPGTKDHEGKTRARHKINHDGTTTRRDY